MSAIWKEAKDEVYFASGPNTWRVTIQRHGWFRSPTLRVEQVRGEDKPTKEGA